MVGRIFIYPALDQQWGTSQNKSWSFPRLSVRHFNHMFWKKSMWSHQRARAFVYMSSKQSPQQGAGDRVTRSDAGPLTAWMQSPVLNSIHPPAGRFASQRVGAPDLVRSARESYAICKCVVVCGSREREWSSKLHAPRETGSGKCVSSALWRRGAAHQPKRVRH